MRIRVFKAACCVILGFFCFASAASASQNHKKAHEKNKSEQEKEVANYYGGVFLLGDGAIPDGPCFRIHGRVTSGNFFDGLKGIDTENGTIFQRGTTQVTQFPDELFLSLAIRDELCPSPLLTIGTRKYLTPQIMGTLHLSLYWKHGVDMRPVGKIKLVNSSVEPIQPYATDLASELPERFLWTYEMAIPSAGVPLTDSLVVVFRAPNGRIAARVAARL
jgi:hypothetical protein